MLCLTATGSRRPFTCFPDTVMHIITPSPSICNKQSRFSQLFSCFAKMPPARKQGAGNQVFFFQRLRGRRKDKPAIARVAGMPVRGAKGLRLAAESAFPAGLHSPSPVPCT